MAILLPSGWSVRSQRFGISPAVARYAFIISIILLFVSTSLLFKAPRDSARRLLNYGPANVDYMDLLSNAATLGAHPIDTLIIEAKRAHEDAVADRSRTTEDAAARYRQRRGRHPPPGFDKWMRYANKHDAVVVEMFFDRIYKDLLPFWALDWKQTASRAATSEYIVRVRGGVVTGVGDTTGKVPWMAHWSDLVKECAEWLPDVDMPFNYLDESRLLVPWEDINALVEKAHMWKRLTPVKDTIREYTGLKAIDDPLPEPYNPPWIKGNVKYWDLIRAACPPDSQSRNASALNDFTFPPDFPEDWSPEYSQQGYVKNFTGAANACTQPHLRTLHGTFVEPISMLTTKELIPLFGGCKLPMNNEIVIPGAMYLTSDPFYSGGNSHGPAWEQKTPSVSWRGVASGGRHKKENWQHFQRLRLIEMLNGTTVSALEANNARSMTFEMPPVKTYDFPKRRQGKIGEWLGKFADAGFVHLLCFPRDSNCSYLSPYFQTVPKKPMEEQYVSKFLPDVDGNSFSARYRGLLLSTSVPIKSTVYAEWHDDRLQPWLHFAPMDNTLQDLYGILDYFTRDPKGDAQARMIAETGKSWGEKVLRRDDMLLYVWRLLLEFARVCDEKRDVLGYVDDLIQT